MEMNNEPVVFVTGVRQFDPVMADTVLKVGTPLYTHPAKTLTDEEIIKELESEIERLQDQLNEFLVAKDLAILRKAQEK